MRRFLLLFLITAVMSVTAQSHTSAIEAAIATKDVAALTKWRKKDAKNPGWTDGTFFKLAAEKDFQDGMKLIFSEQLTCDPVWLNDLIYGYWQQARKDEFTYWGERLLARIKKQTGEEHEEYAFGANTLGVGYYQLKDWEKAEKYTVIGYEKFKALWGSEHDYTENSRQNLIELYTVTKRRFLTEPLLKEAEQYAIRKHGFNSKEKLQVQIRIMELYSFLKRHQDAFTASFQCLLTAEKLYADQPGEFAHVLADYLEMGLNAGTYLDLIKRAETQYLPLVERAWGTTSVQYADALMLVGSLYAAQDEWTRAEEHYVRALPTLSKYVDVQHIIALIKLFKLSGELGRKDQKAYYLDRLMVLSEKFKGADAEDRAGAAMTISAVLTEQGQPAKAIALLESSIAEFSQGDQRPSIYSGLVLQLAHAYYADNQPEKALHYHRTFGNIYQAEGRVPSYTHYKNLALCFMKQRQYDSAHLYTNKAREAYDGRINEAYYDLGTLEARTRWALEDYHIALNVLSWSNHFRLRKINREFFSMSEVERKQFWEENQSHFQLYQRLAPEDVVVRPERAGDLYDVQLQTKGLLLNTTDHIHRLIAKSEDTVLRRDYARWTDARLMWAHYSSYTTEQLLADSIDLKALEAEINTLEKSLTDRSSVFAQVYQAPTWQQVRDRLKTGEAAVEIVRTRDVDSSVYLTKKPYYFALIVKPESEWPEVVVFPHPATMEESGLQYYRNAIRFKLNDTRSYDLYWRPLEPSLQGVKRIFLSADGVYNLINPNTLKNSKTGAFLLDTYEVLSVTNTRELLEEARAFTNKKTAVLAGFPTYDVQTEVYARLLGELPETTTRGAYANASEWLSGEAVVELPGTRSEVDNLTRSFHRAGWSVETFTGEQATENAIREVDNPRVLHIATHGFFINASDEAGDSSDPMLRSGLLLAGVTNFAKADPKPPTEDGILTAYEATSLHLDETELVVLSACETGLGEVQNGEGVYGLQRALRVAGARSVLMSLWKVDDQATQELMTAFYQYWLEGMPRLQAFRRAQSEVRIQFPKPYYWGAFQLLGTD